MWDLWWTKWHWDRFFPEYFGLPLSISFHRCSITRKRAKKIIIIFIIGLHNKPQGCGASVASAAGPFTTKKNFTHGERAPLVHTEPLKTKFYFPQGYIDLETAP
jgi:hypothetical protein